MSVVSVAIQTHPARADLAIQLLTCLGSQGADVSLAVDPDPDGPRSPWRTYRHALETSPACTHRLIVQDDATVCPGFVPAMHAALAARTDELVTFYVGGQPYESAQAVMTAGARREAWAVTSTQRWVPVVALAWPTRLIRPVLDWVDAQQYPESFRGDDEIVGRACTALSLRVLATVPCLVQHPDDVESLIGLRAWAGRDPGRVSCCPVPEGCDAAAIDWSHGLI